METKVEQFEVPRFSLAEREQRWRRVRQLMERDGLDVIIVPSSSGLAGHARYLSSIGGNNAPVAVVFPRSGEVTVLTGPVPSYDYWLRFQDWVTDIPRPFLFGGRSSCCAPAGTLSRARPHWSCRPCGSATPSRRCYPPRALYEASSSLPKS